jgi:hypothetical protein
MKHQILHVTEYRLSGKVEFMDCVLYPVNGIFERLN